MKKLISVLLCGAMLCSMAGCSTLEQYVTTDDNVGALISDKSGVSITDPVVDYELTSSMFYMISGVHGHLSEDCVTGYSMKQYNGEMIYQADTVLNGISYAIRVAKKTTGQSDISGVELSESAVQLAESGNSDGSAHFTLTFDDSNIKAVGNNAIQRFSVTCSRDDDYAVVCALDDIINLVSDLLDDDFTAECEVDSDGITAFLDTIGINYTGIDTATGYTVFLGGEYPICQFDITIKEEYKYVFRIAPETEENVGTNLSGISSLSGRSIDDISVDDRYIYHEISYLRGGAEMYVYSDGKVSLTYGSYHGYLYSVSAAVEEQPYAESKDTYAYNVKVVTKNLINDLLN